jgi:hypothetical protein
MKVKITLIEEMLGTASSNPEIHCEYIASKAADAKDIEEEVAAIGVEAVADKAMTIFPKHDGKPFVYDYQIRGFFKDSCSALARVPGTKSNKLKAFRKVIDGTIFVKPRMIPIQMPAGEEMSNCQRPLRAQTAQGERIALANSETVPAGTVLEFEIVTLDEAHEAIVTEWLNYGELRGIGQWRNSGKGRFTWEKIS